MAKAPHTAKKIINRLWRQTRAGWSIIELLVVIGIVLILLSLAVPAFRRARQQALEVGAESNIRQLGALVTQYAGDNKDLPPVLFRPIVTIEHRDKPQAVQRGPWTVRGHWFNNATLFYYALSPIPPTPALRDPAGPPGVPVAPGAGPIAHFMLAECLYTSPEYWDRWTQAGASQFGAQTLPSIMFPSDKGFMKQTLAHNVPGHEDGVPACCIDSVRSAVLWGDHSTSITDQSRLAPGEPNFYYHSGGAQSFWFKGTPIDWTLHGVRGRDRVSAASTPADPARSPAP